MTVGQRVHMTLSKKFFNDVVPQTTARLHVAKGIIASTPTLEPEYEQKLPFVPVNRFMGKIMNQIRTTAANAIIFSMQGQDWDQRDSAATRTLARVVAAFDNPSPDPHWECSWAQALAHHADGEFRDADALYQRAIDSIRNDPNVCNSPDWQLPLKKVQHFQQRSKAGIRLASVLSEM
ncbi:MAG: hypothetical protein WCP45_12500 [Verrucomicrobiota bacterium]